MDKELNELVLHFQKTGEMKPEVAEFQLTYILNNIQDIYEEYIANYNDNSSLQFQEYVVSYLQEWLVDNNFTIDETSKRYQEMEEELEEEYLENMLSVKKDKSEERH